MVLQLAKTHGLNFKSLGWKGQTVLHALARGDALRADRPGHRAANASIKGLKLLVTWLKKQDSALKDVKDKDGQLAWVSNEGNFFGS